jgi:hypothetical protein
MPVTVQDLADCVRRQMAEIQRLRTENAGLRQEISAFVAWADSDLDAVSYMQRVYSNPNEPQSNRLKSAFGAAPFERAKPPSLVAVAPVKLFDILEARRNAGKLIEQAPPPPDAA